MLRHHHQNSSRRRKQRKHAAQHESDAECTQSTQLWLETGERFSWLLRWRIFLNLVSVCFSLVSGFLFSSSRSQINSAAGADLLWKTLFVWEMGSKCVQPTERSHPRLMRVLVFNSPQEKSKIHIHQPFSGGLLLRHLIFKTLQPNLLFISLDPTVGSPAVHNLHPLVLYQLVWFCFSQKIYILYCSFLQWIFKTVKVLHSRVLPCLSSFVGGEAGSSGQLLLHGDSSPVHAHGPLNCIVQLVFPVFILSLHLLVSSVVITSFSAPGYGEILFVTVNLCVLLE